MDGASADDDDDDHDDDGGDERFVGLHLEALADRDIAAVPTLALLQSIQDGILQSSEEKQQDLSSLVCQKVSEAVLRGSVSLKSQKCCKNILNVWKRFIESPLATDNLEYDKSMCPDLLIMKHFIAHCRVSRKNWSQVGSKGLCESFLVHVLWFMPICLRDEYKYAEWALISDKEFREKATAFRKELTSFAKAHVAVGGVRKDNK
jgi:hypothetical protein